MFSKFLTLLLVMKHCNSILWLVNPHRHFFSFFFLLLLLLLTYTDPNNQGSFAHILTREGLAAVSQVLGLDAAGVKPGALAPGAPVWSAFGEGKRVL